jgi:hypothetical protein
MRLQSNYADVRDGEARRRFGILAAQARRVGDSMNVRPHADSMWASRVPAGPLESGNDQIFRGSGADVGGRLEHEESDGNGAPYAERDRRARAGQHVGDGIIRSSRRAAGADCPRCG